MFCCVAIAALSASIVSSWMTDHGSRSRRGFVRMVVFVVINVIVVALLVLFVIVGLFLVIIYFVYVIYFVYESLLRYFYRVLFAGYGDTPKLPANTFNQPFREHALH